MITNTSWYQVYVAMLICCIYESVRADTLGLSFMFLPHIFLTNQFKASIPISLTVVDPRWSLVFMGLICTFHSYFLSQLLSEKEHQKSPIQTLIHKNPSSLSFPIYRQKCKSCNATFKATLCRILLLYFLMVH